MPLHSRFPSTSGQGEELYQLLGIFSFFSLKPTSFPPSWFYFSDFPFIYVFFVLDFFVFLAF
jgi:hypothetical protein